MSIKSVPHILRLLLELLLLAILLILVPYFSKLWPNAAPTQRGFFCNDASLQYPYREDTVPHSLLNILGLYLPLAIIILIELARYLVTKFRRNSKEELNTLSGEQQLLLQLYLGICAFLLGYACERLFKAVGKFTIGRLRPHFLAVCQPQLLDGSTCADPSNQGRYISEYTCIGVNSTTAMLQNLHVSFPSGHSSMIFYGMVFLALYMQRSFVGHIGRVLRPLLQLLCLLIAWFVALSRVMDFKHHWSDVLAGSILGTAIAVFIFFMRYWVYSGELEGSMGVAGKHNLKCCRGGGGKSNAVLSEVISEKPEKAAQNQNASQVVSYEKSENESSRVAVIVL